MTIKNTSNKIIGFGTVSVLPGATCELGKEFDSSPILVTYKGMGFIEVIEKKPASTSKQGKSKKPDNDEKPAENSPDANETTSV